MKAGKIASSAVSALVAAAAACIAIAPSISTAKASPFAQALHGSDGPTSSRVERGRLLGGSRGRESGARAAKRDRFGFALRRRRR